MADRSSLQQWIIDALRAKSATGTVVEIIPHIWEHHEVDLRASGDLSYRWQYEIRWEGQKLQQAGIIRKETSPRLWKLLS